LPPVLLQNFSDAVPNRSGLLPSVSGYIEQCPERLFVTLTTKRRLTPGEMSAAIGRMMHRVNRVLFGTAYTRRKEVFLAAYAVQEETYDQQLHTHMVLGIPEGALDLKAFKPKAAPADLIVHTWCGLDHGGRPNAQLVLPVTDLKGIIAYVQKDIWSFDRLDQIDLANTKIPPCSAYCPA
jgi:hypothetical protein